jgi:hypothetical protein
LPLASRASSSSLIVTIFCSFITFVVYTAYILLFFGVFFRLIGSYSPLWKYFRDDRDQLTTFPFLLFSYILDLSPPLRLGS